MSLRTEKAYLHWIRRYVIFHGRRPPQELGASAVEAFLTDLATRLHVAASTQNQALAAILFLYRQVLAVDLPWLENIVRATKPRHLPVVLSRDEVRRVLVELRGTPWLVASLLYGGGLRLNEGLALRVKDIDFERGELGVAVRISSDNTLQGSVLGQGGTPSCASEPDPGCRGARGTQGAAIEAGQLPHVPPLLRDPLARVRL